MFKKSEAKKIYKDLKKIIPGLPNKRFTKDYGIKEINVTDTFEIGFSMHQGILVIKNWCKPIPNFNRILEYIKNNFGDVSVQHGKEYINAREYGKEYREYINLELPKNLKELSTKKEIKKQIRNMEIIKDVNNMIEKLRKILKQRKVKIDQKNKTAKGMVLFTSTENDSFKVIEYDNKYFATSIFDMYYGRNLKEAKFLMFCDVTKHNLLRYLETRSFVATEMGPANMLD